MASPDGVPGREAGAFAAEPERGDLTKRAISGAVLAAIAASMLVWDQLPFGLLTTAISMVVAWEWSRLVRGGETDVAVVAHVATAAIGGLLASFDYAALGVAVVAGGALVTGLSAAGRRPWLSAAGVVVSALPAITLSWLRGDEGGGLAATALVMIVAASCDTFSFAAGKLIGGPRLWPSVSPNKTWAGLLGGIVASALAAALFAMISGYPVGWVTLIGLLLGIAGQIGDLSESALKRQFQVKDASGLIPGHGGFMDRVDSLAFAAMLAGALAIVHDPARPSAVLLGG